MPILHNAKKALRSSERKATRNTQTRSRMRSALLTAAEKTTPEALNEAYSRVDRAVKKGLIHKNAAARLKSQAGKKKTK